jgi:hypothetical protein
VVVVVAGSVVVVAVFTVVDVGAARLAARTVVGVVKIWEALVGGSVLGAAA